MTVSSETNVNTYSGNGATTVFAYTFPILDDDEILVQWKVVATGVITTKTKTTHYTVSGVGESSGGNVTFTSGNEPPTGTTVIFTRDMAFTQEVDYDEYDAFPAATHEEALDRLTMIAQQLQADVDRSIKFDASVDVDTILPTPVADAYLKLNSDADGFELGVLADIDAYSMPASNGILAQTSTGVATNRTITAGDARLSITNGDGVSGNPTVTMGGSFTAYGVLTAGTTATGAPQSVTPGTAGYILTSGGASALPTWAQTLPVANGGTGATSVTAYAPLFGGTTATGVFQSGTVGNAGEVLTSNGAGALPTFQASSSISAATQAEQETGSSTSVYVSPGRQQYHPSAAKAFGTYNYSGGIPSIQGVASYNVSSLGDTGTGNVTVNVAVSFSSANYTVVISISNGGAHIGKVGATATGNFQLFTYNVTPAVADEGAHFIAFGDQ
jgi:hypothetical protein